MWRERAHVSAARRGLGEMGGFEVERNFLPLLRFKGRTGTTLVFAGAGDGFFGDDTEDNFEAFEAFLHEGLHVVVALHPRSIPGFAATRGATTDPWRGSDRRPVEEANPDKEKQVNAGERWGFAFERAVVLHLLGEFTLAEALLIEHFEADPAASPKAARIRHGILTGTTGN